MKWRKIMVFFVVSFIFLVGCTANRSKEVTKTEKTISEEQITTNPLPAIYQTAEEQARALEKFPVLYKSTIEAHKDETDFGMYVIPGLLETISLVDDTSHKPSICDSMTPQGVTATDDYLLISSYCNDHEHNSVIYVLDKESREYMKTIVLQGQPHVGGVTYDPIAENIWVCSRYDDRAEIVAFPLAQLEAYDFEVDHEPIEYTQQVELPQLSRASVITYHDSTIYVGYFDPQQEGRLEAYPLDENGQATGQPAFEHSVRTTIDLDKSDTSDEVVRELQGITFYKDKMLITQSYGAMSDSKLLIFDYNKQQTEFLDKQVDKIIELPAHAEQLSEKDGKIYLIFESAAKPYRLVEKTWVDRVLELDYHKLID
ncbi:YncE family protein [Enterococcus sp. LJL99]